MVAPRGVTPPRARQGLGRQRCHSRAGPGRRVAACVCWVGGSWWSTATTSGWTFARSGSRPCSASSGKAAACTSPPSCGPRARMPQRWPAFAGPCSGRTGAVPACCRPTASTSGWQPTSRATWATGGGAPPREVAGDGGGGAAAATEHQLTGGGAGALLRQLVGEELLPQWYDDWVLPERESLEQLRAKALERIARQALEAGDLERSVAAARAASDIDP